MAGQEMVIKVDGMTCNNCAAGISKSLKSAGFDDADASFIDGEVSFTLLEGRSPDEAIDRIKSLGYSIKTSEAHETSGLSAIEKKFLFALVFTVPLFTHMFVPHSWWINDPLVQIALCLPVYALGFAHFGKSAWGSLKSRYANMDVLIFMGSTAAFAYSIAGTVMYWGTPELHNYMFFETTATIITLVLLGNVLEHRSVQQTAVSLGELTKMQASVARLVMRVNKSEKIFETHPKHIKAGDELQVNEGDHVPADGIVVKGEAIADESAITGESEPVQKQVGSTVYSGTVLTSGNLRVSAAQTAQDSTLQQIIDLVKKARKDQPEIQKLGDRVSGIFVPAVIGIAILTFLLAWLAFDIGLQQALMNAVAVLVISCPCAMGLATPTAVVAGVGRAAKNGILIKGGSTLERFAQSRTMIFDKTGTLTSGNFDARWIDNSLGDRAAAIVKGLEMHSSHPIARALSRHWPDIETETLQNVQEEKGKGIGGNTSDGARVFLGAADSSKPTHHKADLELRMDDATVARLSIVDDLKPGARQMVDQLRSQGLKPMILSGDIKEKVLATAAALGIEEAHYEMSPQSKLAFIEKLAGAETIAMVGDGINDGPALSRAQVGISPKGASALAIDSARIAIMHPDEMESIAKAYLISKHTYITIKQNLFWAFFYNVLAIPLAALGFLNPMVAALAMAFSDVVVIGNSLRLKVKKLR